MKKFLSEVPRFLFFTGKGGVGKTSMASSTAVGLADKEKKVLLISTDPASNLDEVFGQPLSSRPTPIAGVSGLFAMNINPIQAAGEYRERMIGPYRGVLPDTAIQQMEEQLSGACTVEIAGFNEFSKFIGDESVNVEYDHIILDTAPTGHTLRLLTLPAAWNDFIAENQTGSSCLGPVSGLSDQKELYEKVVTVLKHPKKTLLVLVTRPETMSLAEAARSSCELHDTGLTNQHLMINGFFKKTTDDPIAQTFAKQAASSLEQLPESLKSFSKTVVEFRASGIMGIEAMRQVATEKMDSSALISSEELTIKREEILPELDNWPCFIDGLESNLHGVIMTMGKGGVGKTTMAAIIAMELAKRGHTVLLSTTDPAAHVNEVIGKSLITNLHVERIDPKSETLHYVRSVLEKNRSRMTQDELALLEEELRSPCIEEIAIFQAFARTVAKGGEQFIVLDTAPTGHTLLLLDSTQAYHREVAKSTDNLPDEVKNLLPRIRDPLFTRVVIVALPEATPVHEAAALQDDLRRAEIEPYGWVLNRSFTISGTCDPTLCTKGYQELLYIREVVESLSGRAVISPWIGGELQGPENLSKLIDI